MNTIIIIAIPLSIAVFSILLGILFTRINIDKNKLTEGLDITKSIVSFIKLTLKDAGIDNDEIDIYSKIILETIEYVKVIPKDFNKEYKIQYAINYSIELCNSFELEINDDRKIIIETTIRSVYNLYEVLKPPTTEAVEFKNN